MRREEFTADAPGQIVRTFDGHCAFVPNSLPGKLQWSDSLVAVISEAESALGKLAGLGGKFPNPKRLLRLFLRREAELSSRIEDTFASVQTQLLFKFLPQAPEKVEETVEVDNNYRALDYGLRAIRRRPLTVSLIKEIHQILLRGVRGQEKSPGRFRSVQAHIGQSNVIGEARFVPSPPHFIDDCMAQLDQFMREDQHTPRLARLAMIHYQFEAIHPFADGNGRVGRAIILLLTVQMGLLPLPLFNPSAYLELHRRQYYDHLLAVSQSGDWNAWINFFCLGMIHECQQVGRRLTALENLRVKYHNAVHSLGGSAKMLKLVDELFHRPVVQRQIIMETLPTGSATAQRYIDRFVNLGILTEVSGNRRGRVYLARDIVKLFRTSSSSGKKP
jgi:Fic family protein